MGMTPRRAHGGPDARGPVAHDFSTNSNACGPCPVALAAVAAADATRYPDPSYARLREALARQHAVDVERVVLAGSASEFIFRISAWAARHGIAAVNLPRYGYGDYAAAATAVGLQPADDKRGALVWACEPSSPLGAADETLLQAVGAGADTVVVLDRAYEPLRLAGTPPSPDAVEAAWQLWSPNKALGLTGVRGAYAIAPVDGAQHVPALDAMAPSWVVGVHGVAMLEAWCEPSTQAWLAACKPQLRAWKSTQAALCKRFGWTVLPSTANYFTCRAPGTVERLEALRESGVALRDCASFGLPGHVRLGVLPPAAQHALELAWESCT
jgi:histidinol-phosphate aminotransferase